MTQPFEGHVLARHAGTGPTSRTISSGRELGSHPDLVSALEHHASARGDHPAFTPLSGWQPQPGLTWRGLADEVAAASASVAAAAPPGTRALLVYPPGIHYVVAFLACLRVGVLPVPAYPPLDRRADRLLAIAADAGAAVCLTEAPFADPLRALLGDGVTVVATTLGAGCTAPRPCRALADDVAFLQYTSGSTSSPRGVMVTHGNLMANEQAIAIAAGTGADSVLLTWLPLYHDMGLIGNVLHTVATGAHCYLASPFDFLSEPLGWLRAISELGATVSGGPNFAYELCVRRLGGGPLPRDLDLRGWRTAFNGAEPVSAETLRRFAAAFDPAGFDEAAFFPCYGLAEATLFVTGPHRRRPPVTATLDRHALAVQKVAAPAEGGAVVTLVSCGSAAVATDVVVADPDRGVVLADGAVGEICVRGAAVAAGYWRRPAMTAAVFGCSLDGGGQRWLRTGDLGFLLDGELYVTGRTKDLIIVNGVNHYPHDVERSVERAHPALRPGCAVAFSVGLDVGERVVVVAEVRDAPAATDVDAVAAAVRGAVAADHDLSVDEVVIVGKGMVPKTSSGKLQRSRCRELFLGGAFAREDAAAREGPDDASRGSSLVEIATAAIAEITGRPRELVDLSASPAAAGLGSLQLVELVGRISQVLGADLALEPWFGATSIADLLDDLVATARPLAEDDGAVTAEEPDARPLLDGERRMWLLEQLTAGERSVYTVPVAVTIDGPLAVEAMRQAMMVVAERHPWLRCVVQTVDGEPVRRAATTAGAPIEVIDCTALAADVRAARTDEVRRQIAEHRFDLAKEVPWVGCLLRLAADRHELLLNFHHIAADGWSVRVVLEDLADVYGALATGRPVPLPAPERFAGDGATWSDADVEHWRVHLGGAPHELRLPRDGERPSRPRFEGRRVSVPLPAELRREVDRLARGTGVTPFVAFLATFGALLQRLTGDDDLVVGTPVAVRDGSQLRRVGPYLNTLPLRLRMTPGRSVTQLLLDVRDVVTSGLAHRGAPFERVLAELGVERQANRSPLVQVMCNHLDFPASTRTVAGVRFEASPVLDMPSKLDMTLYIEDRGDRSSVHLIYDPDLFGDERMREVAAQYLGLLAQVVAGPDRQVADLSLRTPRASELLPDPTAPLELGWSGPAHELVYAHAAARPDHPAIVDDDRVVSYRALAGASAWVADRLREHGVGNGDPVVVVGRRDAKLVPAVLGAMTAGAAVCIVDGRHPTDWLQRRIATVAPAALVTLDGGPDLASRVPALDLGSELWAVAAAHDPERRPWARVHRDSPAVLVFTSGSTGEAKLVCGSHGALTAQLPWQVERFGLGDRDAFALLSAVAHDPVYRDVLTAVWVGGTLVVPDEEQYVQPGYLARWLQHHRLSVVNATPATIRLLAAGGAGVPLPELRLVFSVGESLTGADVERLRRMAPDVVVVNLFGSTEMQRALTHHIVGPADDVTRTNLPVATASPGVQLLVVGSAGLAGTGELGQVVARSPHLALGYVEGRTIALSGGFDAPAVPGVPAGERYATGDLGRYRPDGEVELAGRADQLMNVRGFRVSPEEVEGVLRSLTDVADAAVAPRQRPDGSTGLVAWVVPAERAAGTPPAALARLAAVHLPAHLVPSVWHLVDDLPRNANGKVDRSRLEGPGELPTVAATPDAPLGDTEARMVAAWEQVLGFHVDPSDSFFEVGGDSLLATQLVAHLRTEFGHDVALRDVVEHPTPRELCAALAHLDGAGPGEGWPTIEPDGAARFDPFPLSEIQRAYWIGRQPGFAVPVPSRAYHEFAPADLDVGRLEAAFDRLVACHDMLRAVVLADGRQRVLPQVPAMRIPVADLSDARPAEVEDHLAKTRAEMLASRPEPGSWPLFEVRASHLPGGGWRLHLSVDFLVADASSWSTIGPQVDLLYRRPDADLAEPGLSYRDYVLAVQAMSGSPAHRRDREYWLDRLDSLPAAPALPVIADPASLPAASFTRREWRMSAARWTAVRRRAQALGVTPTALLVTVFADVLALYAREPGFTLNLTVFNRLPLHPDIGSVVGDFTSLTLLEVDARAATVLGDRARALQARLWNDMEHRLFSGVAVQGELARRRGRAAAGMPVVFTSKLGIDDVAGTAGRVRWLGRRTVGVSQTPQVWLDHQVSEDATTGELIVNWDAVDALFPSGLLDDMFSVQRAALEALADREDAVTTSRLATLPALQLARRTATNATAGPVARGLLHDGFVRTALATPDRPAVAWPGGVRTYGEVLDLSSRLARKLVEAGAVPNQPVAVIMRKGWEQVVAVLGVLLAGSAYLPVDADQPEARIRNLLDDADVRLVVNQPSTAGKGFGRPTCVVGPTWLATTEPLPIAPRQRARDLAYVIFTSGSTGRPGGVMIDHRGALNTVDDVNERFRVGERDRVLGLSSLSFDLSVYDIFGPLAVGGMVVLPGPDSSRDPAAWLRLADEHGVTIWNSVPQLVQMAATYAESRGGRFPSSLRLFMMSGDWIPVTLPDRVRALAGDPEIVSLGGATEASIWSILYPIGEVDPEWPSIPYGRPMRNQTFHALDDDLRPRPDGVPGELFIGGTGVAVGYWRDPERTAARFVLHPDTGERMYRTGDLGRYLPSGDIEFLGRTDFQVKVQGYRVELGEIEAALLTHESVESCVVTAVGGRGDANRLVGYVVARSPAGDLEQELKAHVASLLPRYMVPAAVVRLEQLPLSPNGKVNRKALPAPSFDVAPPDAPVPAAGTLAERIAATFAEVLGRPAVGPDDSFFDIGGTSVEIVNVHARLVTALGREFPIALAFEHETPRRLAGALAASLGPEPPAENVVAEMRNRSAARRKALGRRRQPRP